MGFGFGVHPSRMVNRIVMKIERISGFRQENTVFTSLESLSEISGEILSSEREIS